MYRILLFGGINMFENNLKTIPIKLSALVNTKRFVPIKIVVIYMIIGSLWIYFSDSLTITMSNNLLDFKTLQNIKGFIFIIFTSIILYILIHSNINMILNLEKQIKDREKQNRLIVDSITNGIWDWEIKTDKTYFSPTYKSKLGYKEDEIENTFKGWEKLVHPDDIKKTLKIIQQCIQDKTTKYEVEFRMKTKKGDYAWILSRGIVVMDDKGVPTNMIGTHMDITERKEAEKEHRKVMEENKKLLEETLEYDKLKTEFFSNISHELRTPLNIILSTAQLLNLYNKDKKIDYNRIDKSIHAIKQNCYRLLRLINNVMDMSKIESNFLGMNLQNYNIVSVVEEITLDCQQYIESKGLTLEFDTEIEEKIMACDADKIERIILNLFSNSVKNTKVGDKITVNIYDENEYIVISVKDTGIGIPEDKLEIIFERFRQTDALLTRSHEGSGIGLSLVKALVEMHGGEIFANSKVGYGSEFSIRLPIRMLSNEESNSQRNNLIMDTNIEKIDIEFSDIYSA